jgi:NRPS condensation-like uncharacterized protein
MTNNRQLVPAEQAMEILNRCANSYNVVTISRIKGPFSEEIIRQALDLVQCRHPRLNSRIVGALDNLRFETEGTQKIPLRVVNKSHNEQWQEVVLEEMNEKIDSSKVLLRAVLVRIASENSTSYLLTTVHHAITDGLSGIRLHSELLTYCKTLASGEGITQVPSLPALPPVEELLPESIKGFRGIMKSVLFVLRVTLQQLWNRPETLGFEKYVPIELRSCGMVHRQLDEELTQKLINCCRNEKTTVQGALCAAMLLAAARKITALNRTEVRVSCQSFVDLRQRLKPVVSDENVSLLASFLNSYHTLRTNTSFWELARDVKQQLEAGLERNDIFIPVLMFRKMIESLLNRPNEVPVTVVLTNVGRVNIPKVYGPFELEEISFVPAQAVFGGIFAAAVATFEEKMLLNFVFSEPSISRDTMESLVDSVMSCIVDVCDRSTSTRQTYPESARLTSSGV